MFLIKTCEWQTDRILRTGHLWTRQAVQRRRGRERRGDAAALWISSSRGSRYVAPVFLASSSRPGRPSTWSAAAAQCRWSGGGRCGDDQQRSRSRRWRRSSSTGAGTPRRRRRCLRSREVALRPRRRPAAPRRAGWERTRSVRLIHFRPSNSRGYSTDCVAESIKQASSCFDRTLKLVSCC